MHDFLTYVSVFSHTCCYLLTAFCQSANKRICYVIKLRNCESYCCRQLANTSERSVRECDPALWHHYCVASLHVPRGKSGPASAGTEYRLMPSACRREWCTNAKANYSSSVVPPDPSVHFYHCTRPNNMTAHVCAHPDGRSASSNWGALQKSGGQTQRRRWGRLSSVR